MSTEFSALQNEKYKGTESHNYLIKKNLKKLQTSSNPNLSNKTLTFSYLQDITFKDAFRKM